MIAESVLIGTVLQWFFVVISAQSLDFCTYWRSLNLEKTKPECVFAESLSYCIARGEVFQSCGSPCPPTCSNPFPNCVQQCASGCFCQPGYLRDATGHCILSTSCLQSNSITPIGIGTGTNGFNLCQPLSATVGVDCRPYAPIRRCTNVIDCSLTANPVCCPTNCGFSVCMQLQAPFQSPCQMMPQLGTCAGALARYYFNYANQRCDIFTYSGCGGNANNFVSLADCQATCQTYLSRKK